MGSVVLRLAPWQVTSTVHTIMEVASTVLALMVGIIALVRFYSKKSNTYLFIGAGFLGTALLDGYHAIATFTPFSSAFPSLPPSLVPWSWVASRMFLSILLFLSWWAYRRRKMSQKGTYCGRRSFATLRNYLKTRKCHSELVSESPNDGNNPDEILKRVQDDTLVYVLR